MAPDAFQLSADEAASFLHAYHLTPTTVGGVFARLGSVQYDPLNPCGRNTDLVLQARVPGYRVDGWQRHVYDDRQGYDAWDKQACHVPIEDWPLRAIGRRRYRPWHDTAVLHDHPEAVHAILAEIDRRGPLSSLEFEDRTRIGPSGSWMGPTRTRRILRALAARGDLVTHHREAGRHYFDRPERVIPAPILNRPELTDVDAYHRWVVLRRHQAAGMLRPGAPAELWSACGEPSERRRALAELVESGALIPIHVGTGRALYHMPADLVTLLGAAPQRGVVFLGPLDSLLWDRQAVRTLFGFAYTWEVYKRPADRLWGYYVLPVAREGRFIGRVDLKRNGLALEVDRWWWEEGTTVDAELIDQVSLAFVRFLAYLGVRRARCGRPVPREVRAALREAARVARQGVVG